MSRRSNRRIGRPRNDGAGLTGRGIRVHRRRRRRLPREEEAHDDEAADGQRVEHPGFGTFEVKLATQSGQLEEGTVSCRWYGVVVAQNAHSASLSCSRVRPFSRHFLMR